MIPLWKGKNPIYFGVIRSKVKVTVTINRFFESRVVSARCGRGRILFILGSLGQRSRSQLLYIEFLTTESFPHNFSSVYWIFTKLDHMIALWKGKNLNYFEIIRSKVKVTVTIHIIFDNRVVSA
jgi:hypothetical protein